jgi:CBS domain-containing membrane protein
MTTPKLVRDIMTREVVTLYEEDSLTGVAEGMQRFRFRHLPVVDDNALVGLITHRDLLRVAASSLEPGNEQKTQRLQQGVFARDVMRRDVITVGEETTLAEAGQLLWDKKLGCLPVVDADQKLLGIVTEADFVKLAVRFLKDAG